MAFACALPSRIQFIDDFSDLDTRSDAGMTLQLTVNLSAINLLEPDFCSRAATVLAAHGCDKVQGCLFARPLTPPAFAAWFEERRAACHA